MCFQQKLKARIIILQMQQSWKHVPKPKTYHWDESWSTAQHTISVSDDHNRLLPSGTCRWYL